MRNHPPYDGDADDRYATLRRNLAAQCAFQAIIRHNNKHKSVGAICMTDNHQSASTRIADVWEDWLSLKEVQRATSLCSALCIETI